MSWVDFLIGCERLKRRGDRFFLGGNFDGALRAYLRARRVVRSTDARATTLEALIRECSARCGERGRHHDVQWSARAVETDSEAPFEPAIHDLFELAIADKLPERAVLYHGQNPEFEAGYVSLVQGDASEAVSRLTAAAERGPSFVVELELGRALSLAGDMEGARSALERAVALAPDDPEGLDLLAAVEIQLQRYRNAEERLSRRVARGNAGAATYFLLGRVLAEEGRTEESLESYRRAMELDPHFADACYEASRLARHQGNVRGAFDLLGRACALVPDEVAYNREMADLVLKEGLDVAAGLAACDRLMVTDEDNCWRYLGWIAELYLRRGWRREARDPLVKALSLVPPECADERRDLERRLAALDPDTSG